MKSPGSADSCSDHKYIKKVDQELTLRQLYIVVNCSVVNSVTITHEKFPKAFSWDYI